MSFSKKDCSKFVIYEKKYTTGIFIKTMKIDTIKGLEVKKNYIRKFISYNKFEKESEKIPEEYKKREISLKTINDFYCGSIKILTKDNNFYKKIIKKYNGYKSFMTRWNGGKPYLIYFNDKEAFIYYIPSNVFIDNSLYSEKEDDNKWMYIKLAKKYIFSKIYIGKSPKLYTNKPFYGNTILLKINENKYIFIDECIKEFTYKNEIINFISPIGISDIPLPYAIDRYYNYIIIYDMNLFHGSKNIKDPNLYYENLDKNKLIVIKNKIVHTSPGY